MSLNRELEAREAQVKQQLVVISLAAVAVVVMFGAAFFVAG
mgnify:CR=1 FL=1